MKQENCYKVGNYEYYINPRTGELLFIVGQAELCYNNDGEKVNIKYSRPIIWKSEDAIRKYYAIKNF